LNQLEQTPEDKQNEDYYKAKENILNIVQQINDEISIQGQREQDQLSIVQQLKSEYEAISTPLNNLNDIIKSTLDNLKKTSSEIGSIISNFKVSLDLSASKINIKGFDDLKDIYSSIGSALKKNIVLDTSTLQSANQLIKAKDSIIVKAKSLLSLTGLTKNQEQEIQAILQNQYSTQIRKNLAESKILEKLEQEKKIYKEIQDFEEKLARKKEKQQDRVDSIQDEIDAINEEADAEDKAQQISDAKLKIQEQEVALQEKKNDLLQIEADIMDVMKDKRFELITTEGQRILTYDVAKVSKLEEQKIEAQKNIDEASQAVIDSRQDLSDLKKDLAKQEQIEELELDKEKAQKKLDNMEESFNKEREKYATQLMEKYKDYFESENDLVTIATDGANGRLDAIYKEITERRKLYDVQVNDAYTAGQNIAQAQIAGMQSQEVPTNIFTELTQTKIEPTLPQEEQKEDKASSEESTTTIEQIQQQTQFEIQAEQDKQKSILKIIISSAKEKMAQIVKSQQEIYQNFIEYWKMSRELEITKFGDVNIINAEGYNNLLKIYVNYMTEQRTMWKQAAKDAYDAGKAMADAFSAGKSGGGGYSAPSFSPMNYNQLSYIPTVSTSNLIQNAVTVILNPSQSDAVMSTLQSYLPTALASN
jgi:hypothetical protein